VKEKLFHKKTRESILFSSFDVPLMLYNIVKYFY